MDIDVEKDKIIKKAYFSPTGLAPPGKIYQDVRIKDRTITLAYVRGWYDRNIERKKATGGTNNSYVAPRAYHEYQIDLFYITKKQFANQIFPFGMSVIDVFSKYATVIPLKERKFANVRDGLLEAFKQMGRKPQIVYSDDERALTHREAAQFFEDIDVQHITTVGAAHFVERFNRTFRTLMHVRMEYLKRRRKFNEKTPNPESSQWHTLIPLVMSIYNNINVSVATGKTPAEARKPSNEIDVKNSMELRAKRGRLFPPLAVGDEVKVLRSKNNVGEKEFMGNFKMKTHTITAITESFGQPFYRLSNGKEHIRTDIVKV